MIAEGLECISWEGWDRWSKMGVFGRDLGDSAASEHEEVWGATMGG